MKNLITGMCLLVMLVVSVPGQEAHAANPFFTQESPQEETPEQVRRDNRLRAIPYLQEIASVQRDTREKMTGFAREIQKSPSGSAMFKLLGLAMFYGVLHALGPGHGKSIVCSYFLSRKGSYRQAIVFGNCLSFAHVISATVIVLLLSLLGRQTNLFEFHDIENRLETLSYLLIGLIGLFLFYKVARELYSGVSHNNEQNVADGKSMAGLSLSAGLIPCPGAAIILLFSLSQGVLWAGLLAMIPLAAGMGMTTSIVGLATVGSKAAALGAVRSYDFLFRALYTILALAGVLLINALGWGLFLQSL